MKNFLTFCFAFLSLNVAAQWTVSTDLMTGYKVARVSNAERATVEIRKMENGTYLWMVKGQMISTEKVCSAVTVRVRVGSKTVEKVVQAPGYTHHVMGVGDILSLLKEGAAFQIKKCTGGWSEPFSLSGSTKALNQL